MSESGGSEQVKGILKRGKGNGNKAVSTVEDPKGGSGIQWDEMSILMTEHPANKDYGHMKIDEPKTPYHEMLPDEASSSTPPDTLFSPEMLAQKVQEASSKQEVNRWEEGGGDSSEEDTMSEETKEHKQNFSEWRKKHYNEFFAVKRAKELMAQDDEELMEVEKQGSSSLDEASLMDDDQSN